MCAGVRRWRRALDGTDEMCPGEYLCVYQSVVLRVLPWDRGADDDDNYVNDECDKYVVVGCSARDSDREREIEEPSYGDGL